MAEGFLMGGNLHIFLMYTVHQRELSKHGEKVLGKHFFPLSTKYCLLFHFVLTLKSTIIPHYDTTLRIMWDFACPLFYSLSASLMLWFWGRSWDVLVGPPQTQGWESYTTAPHEAIFWRMVRKGAVKDVIFILFYFFLYKPREILKSLGKCPEKKWSVLWCYFCPGLPAVLMSSPLVLSFLLIWTLGLITWFKCRFWTQIFFLSDVRALLLAS